MCCSGRSVISSWWDRVNGAHFSRVRTQAYMRGCKIVLPYSLVQRLRSIEAAETDRLRTQMQQLEVGWVRYKVYIYLCSSICFMQLYFG